MSKEVTELQQLFAKYINNTISPAELKLFWQLMAAAPDNDAIHSNLRELWQLEKPHQLTDEYDYRAAFDSIKTQAMKYEQQPVVPWFRKWGWAAAAVLIMVLSAGLTLYLNNRPLEQNLSEPASVIIQNVKACTGCATLTLADGTLINLDSAGNGNLAVQGETRILKMDAGLTYQAGENEGDVVSYNTISTPKGGMYQVTLPDGSLVWLNAASSIRFPTAFTGNERRVEVKGEMFFEVRSNARLPFKVSVGKSEIRVLGTSFNVNAYEEDDEVKTTLLNGSIKVSVNNHSQMLKPGEQLLYDTQLEKIQVREVNIDDVIAWKEGFFHFDNADVQTIMRQIARWYNVEVVYEGKIPARGFKGEIGRDLSLGDITNFLKKLKVNANLEGNKLVIRP